VVLRPGDIVICRECGYRILYKKRTKQSESPVFHCCLRLSFCFVVTVSFTKSVYVFMILRAVVQFEAR